MSELAEQIQNLEKKAHALKESRKYVEALKKFDELIAMQKELYGAQSESIQKSSQEAAIICNILSMSFLQKENFNVALELLRKAESLTEDGDKYRAVTYNNFACIFRRTKKLRSALSYLEKALEIEYNYLHYSEESVDDCLQVLNPTDIHLNICAILSQMGKHELALQHAMKALILIQDELITKIDMQAESVGLNGEIKRPEDRLTVLCIAYHNIAVEQEFLKQYQASLNSYAKAAQQAHKYLGAAHPMTQNMNEVLNQATKKIANVMYKTMNRQQKGAGSSIIGKGVLSSENLESLIRE